MSTQQNDCALSADMLKRIDEVIAAHDNDSTQLIGILLDVQQLAEAQYISEAAAYYLAAKLNLPATAIYDAISFYSSLSAKPRAKFPIQVCQSVVCRINENAIILSTLTDVLGIGVGQTTYDKKFTIEEVPCFGACDVAPAVRVNGRVYGHLSTREKIIDMLNSLEGQEGLA